MTLNFWAYFLVLFNFFLLREEVTREYLFFGAFLILIRWISEIRGWARLPKNLVQLLVIPATIYTWQQEGTVFGLVPGLSLLTVLVSLKVLERKDFRGDISFSISVFLLVAAQWILSLDLFNSVIGSITVLYFTFYLLKVSSPHLLNKELTALHWRLWLRGAPLALVLFIFFPRIQGMMPLLASQKVGQTGLSDELRPGSISVLLKSEDPVMHFEIKSGNINNLEGMYFKALELTSNDGFHWFAPLNRLKRQRLENEILGDGAILRVTLEPTETRWLALPEKTTDVRILSPPQMRLERVGNVGVEFHTSLLTKTVLDVEVNGGDLLSEGLLEDQSRLYRVPKVSPEVKDLVEKIVKNKKLPSEKVNALMDFFSKYKFKYTLTPGESHARPLDYFLFESKAGYCEHFASALAIMARLANVPSKTIVGYLGAESNGVGDFYTITQASAHAWVEYFHESGQWVRVDPTEMVAPDRISLSGADYRELIETGIDRRKQYSGFKVFIDGLGFLAESFNYRWTQWVVEYGLSDQLRLMDQISQGSALRAFLWVVVVAGLALLFPTLFNYFVRIRQPKDLLVSKIERMLKCLTKSGYPDRIECQSLGSYLRTLDVESPLVKKQLQDFVRDYEVFRYQNRGSLIGLYRQIKPLERALCKHDQRGKL